MSMTAAQCRAARGLLDWTVKDLSSRSQVHSMTITRFERGHAQSQPSTVAAMRRAFEAAGLIFLDPNGEGAGVRLKKGSENDA